MNRIAIATLLLFASISLNAQWQAVGGGLNSSSHGMTLWNSTLVDVGSFNNPCNKVASWNGSTWSCFAGGVGLVGRAAVEFNGDLVVVGDFWNVQQPCVGCNGIARWNGTAWQPLGTGFNNDVLCIIVWNGQLVAAGDFTQANGNPVSRIARWTGTTWVGIGGVNDFDNDIRGMAVYDGELWVGGDFNNVGGCTPCDGVVRWDGTAWVGGNSGVDLAGGVDSTVRCFFVDQASNRLYMGGHFLELNGDPAMSGVAYYDGSDWFPMGTGVNSYVRALGKYNGTIIVGGDFTTANGAPANKIARWNPSSGVWAAMGTGMNDYVKAIEVYNGGLYAGGPFTTADGLPRTGIAKWVDLNVPPTAAFNTANVNLCSGECAQFSDASSSSPTSWSWSIPGASPSTSTLQNPQFCFPNAGSYSVTLIVNNASGADTVTISNYVTVSAPPVVNAGSDQSACANLPLQLQANGATTYSWSPAAGLSCTTCSNPIATVSGTTTFVVTGTGAGSCTDTDSMTITIVPPPNVTAGSDDTLCAGTSVQLSATGASNFTWTPAAGLSCTFCSSPIASPVVSTTYVVTGYYQVNCADTDTVFIEVLPAPVVNAGNDQMVCQGTTVTLTATGADQYNWTGSVSNGGSFIPPSTASYIVTGEDVNGCEDQDTVIVTVHLLPNTQFSFSMDTLCDTDPPVTLGGTPSGGVYAGTGVSGNQFYPSAVPFGWHLITYEYMDVNGCSKSDSDSVYVWNCLQSNYAPAENLITVFPNPSEGGFYIAASAPIDWMEITDLTGRVVQSVIRPAMPVSADLSQQPAGVYFLRLGQGAAIATTRLILISE
jgi:PKD repeat protein